VLALEIHERGLEAGGEARPKRCRDSLGEPVRSWVARGAPRITGYFLRVGPAGTEAALHTSSFNHAGLVVRPLCTRIATWRHCCH